MRRRRDFSWGWPIFASGEQEFSVAIFGTFLLGNLLEVDLLGAVIQGCMQATIIMQTANFGHSLLCLTSFR